MDFFLEIISLSTIIYCEIQQEILKLGFGSYNEGGGLLTFIHVRINSENFDFFNFRGNLSCSLTAIVIV